MQRFYPFKASFALFFRGVYHPGRRIKNKVRDGNKTQAQRGVGNGPGFQCFDLALLGFSVGYHVIGFLFCLSHNGLCLPAYCTPCLKNSSESMVSGALVFFSGAVPSLKHSYAVCSDSGIGSKPVLKSILEKTTSSGTAKTFSDLPAS